MEIDYPEIRRQLGKYKNVQGLMQYINVDTLKDKHEQLNGNKATGIDKVTKEEYEENLDDNIAKLVHDMKNFSYKPLPVKRVYIPKGNGGQRPLGTPSYEDKLVQGVMTDILTEIYEWIFLDCSYGFRPNRDCHKALKQLDTTIMRKDTNFIVDADIKGFFNHVNHDWLIKFLEHTIKDKNFIRYIKRFLKAGIIEDGVYYEDHEGTPQGALISPVLANVYLHYVLDLWFELYIKVKCKGSCNLIRYADDFVACFEFEEEAKWFYQELIERLAKFGLEIETSKTKIFPFGRKSKTEDKFDFLGFTIQNGTTRNGYYRTDYKTSKKKTKAKKENIRKHIREHWNRTPEGMIKSLNRILNGYYQYYGISFNMTWLRRIYRYVLIQFKWWRGRRSQRGKTTWEKLFKILKYNPLVEPKITFSLW